MDLVFTDLDGTLLDRETYSWEAARPALERLRRRRIPWLLVSSKTRAEIELWRLRMGNEHPFVVENGGAAYVPLTYFGIPIPGAARRDAYEVIEWGTPWRALAADLAAAAASSGCRVRGISTMTPEEISALCGLPYSEALLAKQREYDEPYLVLDPERESVLQAEIEKRGRHCTWGDRFRHILGANDKAVAVRALSALYRQQYGRIRAIGLGDAINDAPLLNAVDIPLVVRSADAQELKRLAPRATVTELAGPAGWNDAVLALIGE